MFSYRLRYYYTTESLSKLRIKYNLQVCFKSHLTFIRKQSLISRGLSNRISIHSNFIKSYKQLKYFYIKLLRSNLISNEKLYNDKYKFKAKDISYFYSVYLQSPSLNDLDRVLVWRSMQTNSVFSIKQTEKKKKKKFIYKSRIYFLEPHKRILLVWRWLSIFIKSFSIKDKNWEVCLIPSLENFLTATPSNHIITDMKLQVYKMQLLRTS